MYDQRASRANLFQDGALVSERDVSVFREHLLPGGAADPDPVLDEVAAYTPSSNEKKSQKHDARGNQFFDTREETIRRRLKSFKFGDSQGVLEREERLDPAAAAVADDHDGLHLEGADGVLDGGPDAGVPGLHRVNKQGRNVSKQTHVDEVSRRNGQATRRFTLS
jgi:hypothetical protein